MSDQGVDRAMDGLLREYARMGVGTDPRFVAEVMAATRTMPPRPRRARKAQPRQRRFPWWLVVLTGSLAAAGVATWSVSSVPPAPPVAALPPPTPAPKPPVPPAEPAIAVKPPAPATPRAPVLTPLGTSPAAFGYATWYPIGYEQQPERRWPLLVFVHGLGENGDGITQLDRTWRHGPGRLIAEGSPWFDDVIVVAPQSKEIWKRILLDETITLFQNTMRIDPKRIYMTGVSSGGGLAWWYGLANGRRLAALVPMAGSLGAAPAVPFKQVIPVWAFHGAQDPMVTPAWTVGWMSLLVGVPAPSEPGRWVFANGAWQAYVGDPPEGAKQLMSMMAGAGHECWVEGYRDPALWRWVFEQQRE